MNTNTLTIDTIPLIHRYLVHGYINNVEANHSNIIVPNEIKALLLMFYYQRSVECFKTITNKNIVITEMNKTITSAPRSFLYNAVYGSTVVFPLKNMTYHWVFEILDCSGYIFIGLHELNSSCINQINIFGGKSTKHYVYGDDGKKYSSDLPNGQKYQQIFYGGKSVVMKFCFDSLEFAVRRTQKLKYSRFSDAYGDHSKEKFMTAFSNIDRSKQYKMGVILRQNASVTLTNYSES